MLPNNWCAEEDIDNLLLYNPSGNGAITISFFSVFCNISWFKTKRFSAFFLLAVARKNSSMYFSQHAVLMPQTTTTATAYVIEILRFNLYKIMANP